MQQTTSNSTGNASTSALYDAFPETGLFSRELFQRMLQLEHKRAARSGRPFILIVLQPKVTMEIRRQEILARVLGAIARSTRATDLKGWYEGESAVGVIFTELGSGASNLNALLNKFTASLCDSLSQDMNLLNVSYDVYPERYSSDVQTASVGQLTAHAAEA